MGSKILIIFVIIQRTHKISGPCHDMTEAIHAQERRKTSPYFIQFKLPLFDIQDSKWSLKDFVTQE